jgi:hypothetical protein
VLGWLDERAGGCPHLLVVEDVHDADTATRELVGELVARGSPGAALLTARAVDRSLDIADPGMRVFQLEPLGRSAARRLVRERAEGRPLGAAVVNEIVERSGGVPLFVEELTAATVAAASASGAWRDVTPDEVPSSLQASLLGRLDRLGQLKVTAQRCAVIGGEFDVATAGLVVDRDRRAVAAELAALVDEGVLAVAGRDSFRFAHPLLEEAAYQSVLRRDRELVHARLADHFTSLPAAPAGVRAAHLDAAGRHDEAARFWSRAALAAIQRSEHPEAAALARRALGAVARLPRDEDTDRLERRALILLSTARVMSLSGDEELTDAAVRARSLAQAAGDDGQFVAASILLVTSLQATGNYVRAEEVAAEAVEFAAGRLGPAVDDVLQHFLGATQIWRGRVEEGFGRLAPITVEPPKGRHDGPTVTTTCARWSLAGLVDQVQGRPADADHRFDIATAHALAAETPQALCLTRATRAIARQVVGDADDVYVLTEPTLELALDLGDDWWVVWAQVLLGWSMAVAARDQSGVALIDEALAHLGPLRQLEPYFHGLRGAALGATGRPHDGIDAVLHGLDVADTTGERFFVPLLHHTAADLLAAMHADGKVVSAARAEAVAVARAQAQWLFATPPAAAAVVDGVDVA